MVRKSRKRLQDAGLIKANSHYKYIAGGYLRVSANDTNSIETQKQIIQNYVDKDPDIFLKRLYIDDGISSFFNNKPAFNELTKDIENLSPGRYMGQGMNHAGQPGIWTRNAVVSILRNRAYIGIHVMGKTRTSWWQMRKSKRVTQRDWIMAFGHHEPIVERNLFQNVQLILNSRKKTRIPHEPAPYDKSYLGNALFCGDCGRKMKRHKARDKIYYICPRYAESKGACTSKRINESQLIEDILESILLEIEKVKAYRKNQLEYEESPAFNLKNSYLHKRLNQISDKIALTDNSMQNRYENLALKMIDGSDYLLVRDYIEKQRDLLKAELSEILTELDHYQRNISSNCTWVNEFLKYADAEEITEDMYKTLVERVLMHDTRIQIIFFHTRHISSL